MLGIYCRTSRESESSIEQQKKLGIEFAIANNFDYMVFEDEGISGFKISDDDVDPFSNRPSFASMINDIKAGKITKVWVFEHSRLSRNQYASAHIFNTFEKYKIELYERNKKLDLNDPQFQMMRGILSAISQYERHLIVNRTTRGLHNAINNGKRGMPNLFGYNKTGKDNNGKQIWEPVESEINLMEQIYKKYLSGQTLKSIALDVYGETKDAIISYSTRLSQRMKNAEYTGYSLTIEGLDISHKYDKFELDDIFILRDMKYWVKSVPYPIQIISIEDWLKCREKLHANSIYFKERTEKSRNAKSDLATGIISCPLCDCKYYTNTVHNGKGGTYHYYKHLVTMSNSCQYKPKTVNRDNTDEIFKNFFFYNAAAFSNSNTMIIETQEKIKQNILNLENKIKTSDKEVSKLKKQINTLSNLLADVTEVDAIRITTRKIAELEKTLSEKIPEHSASKIELEKLKTKYANNEKENAYVNMLEKLDSFFFTDDIEYQRNQLLRVIKKAVIYKNIILIDTGFTIYLFDTNIKYIFDTSIFAILNDTDEDFFKKYFMLDENTFNKTARQLKKENHKDYENIVALREKILYGGMGYKIQDLKLKSPDSKNLLKYIKEIFEILEIDYDYSNHSNIVLFFDY